MAIAAPGRAFVARPRRRAKARMLATLSLVAACLAGASAAQAQSRDLWQTYMEAALASNQAGDFTTEAITLNAAFTFAKRHDPKGPRPFLTRLPLVLAYGELGRQDLVKPLTDLKLPMDVLNLDARYDAYIDTIDSYASSYDDRARAHENDDPYDSSRQTFRIFGSKQSYLTEIALRATRRPADKIGLANAMASAGVAYKRDFDYECAAYDYARAFQMFQDFDQLRDATATATANFSVGGTAAPGDRQGATGQVTADTEAAVLQALATNMRFLAYRTLHPKSNDAPAKTDMSECDRFGPQARTPPAVGFDAQVARAAQYLATTLKLTAQLHHYWHDNPLFGWLDYNIAQTHELEIEMAKTQPGKYPEALAKARKAYEGSLLILSHAFGTRSQPVRQVAADYVDLLVKVRLNEEAEKIEAQYAVTRRVPSMPGESTPPSESSAPSKKL
ncbi:MAG TPA: hypothetical protein VKX28_33960 [Xanthobacteraceae bacterium]|nr:hypothetical protein [Xanthobacteraceae bacterium]